MDYKLARLSAMKLYEHLRALSQNREVLAMLDSQDRFDVLKTLPVTEGLDSRLTIVCVADIIKCFENLGHEFNRTSDESLILSIFLVLTLSGGSGRTLTSDEKSMHMTVEMGIPEGIWELFHTSIQIGYNPRRLLLIDLMRENHISEEPVNKLAVLIYRFVLQLAEADDRISVTEKDWLAELMTFRNPDPDHKPQEPKEESEPEEPEISPMEELQQLIGLESVKREVENVYNLCMIQKLRREKGLKSSDISYHCVFTGNPGTGKTTVARIIARIYKEMGLLKKGHLVETDRSGLVGEYVGQTAVKTNKIIDSAIDGVLFIDEAYALAQGTQNDYGQEAIATLLKRMEDDRHHLVVIIAGYSSEMSDFINANPGLQSRFNRYIHFDDYTAKDLFNIYEFNLRKYDYRLSESGAHRLRLKLEEEVAHKGRNFGNARFVRNLFEKTLEQQARRLVKCGAADEQTLSEIIDEDIP